MTGPGRRTALQVAATALVAALAVAAAGCGGGGKKQTKSDTTGTAASNLPTSIGKGEGKLNVIAWLGYTEDKWVKPFQRQTGCIVHRKYAGSSDEMVTLMRSGGGGQYDLVSASGDASVRLIVGKDVQPVNVDLIPGYQQFRSQLKSPAHNTVDGKHYGVSYMWGPNTLLWNTQKVKPAPTSWEAIYNPKFKGQVTVPDNPIQIADAALYLSKSKPALGITDPYELSDKQFNAAINLLKQQQPLIKKYWSLGSDEIAMFKNGDTVVGASWPYQTSVLKTDKVPVRDSIPKEGATGWADTWMLSAKAKHSNCAYRWMKYASTAKVQGEVANFYGTPPGNAKACAFTDFCKQYPASYLQKIKFWKTPQADCGNGKTDCVPYTRWVSAWTSEVKG
jgi:putative spermidine/putrescine transport system substrate-binding protein